MVNSNTYQTKFEWIKLNGILEEAARVGGVAEAEVSSLQVTPSLNAARD